MHNDLPHPRPNGVVRGMGRDYGNTVEPRDRRLNGDALVDMDQEFSCYLRDVFGSEEHHGGWHVNV
jgi:hypothetical protein